MKTFKKSLLIPFILITIYMGSVYPQIQNCLDFDGFNDHVQVVDNGSLLFTPITGEAWINLQNIPSPASLMGTVFAKYDNNTNSAVDYGGYLLYVSITGLPGVVIMSNSLNVNTSITGSIPLIMNSWHHMAFTYTTANLKLYIDGELVASSGSPVVMGGTANPLEIGRISNKPQPVYPYGYFPGKIDEIRIWNAELTQEQIRYNMYHEIPDFTTLTDLKAYYKFNHTSGTVLSDLTANPEDGTLYNMNPATDWIVSTAPIPYYTAGDGDWYSNATWGDQRTPLNYWARVNIKHQIFNAGWVWDTEVIELVIDDGASLTIAPGIHLTVSEYLYCNLTSGLILQSYPWGVASLLYSGLGVSGTMETSITQNKWHFISTPVAGIVSGIFTGEYLQMHDEASNQYSDIIPVNHPLNTMQGYALWTATDKNFSYSGALNSGPFIQAVTKYNQGWNLVGNPYPSSIDWDAPAGWTKIDINDAIYIENSGGWATYINGVGTNGGTRFIAPGQGFFVNCYSHPGILMMDDYARVHNNTSFFKDEISNYVKLKVSGTGYTDETVVRFVDSATDGFDGQWDAYKLSSMEELPEIFSLSGETEMAINALPSTESVQLGFRGQPGEYYTFEATELSDLPYVILEDKLTGISTDLSETGYTFSYQPDAGTRFILHFTPMGIDKEESQSVNITVTGRDIQIPVPQSREATAVVFNLLGQLIISTPLNNDQNTITLDHPGIYIVRVNINDQSYTEKVTIR